MDPWRIALLVAAVCFVAFLIVKMRPRGPAALVTSETAAERRERRRERRILRLAAGLSTESLERLRDELDLRLHGEDSDDGAEP